MLVGLTEQVMLGRQLFQEIFFDFEVFKGFFHHQMQQAALLKHQIRAFIDDDFKNSIELPLYCDHNGVFVPDQEVYLPKKISYCLNLTNQILGDVVVLLAAGQEELERVLIFRVG